MKKLKIIPVKWIQEKHDTDQDGVINCKDCDPWNPKKQAFPFGIYPLKGGMYGVFRQTHLGATTIKKGDPVFVGRLPEANAFLDQIKAQAQQQVSGM